MWCEDLSVVVKEGMMLDIYLSRVKVLNVLTSVIKPLEHRSRILNMRYIHR